MGHTVFYRPEFVRSQDDFDTTRKAGWLADSLTTSPIAGVAVSIPQPVARDAIAKVHSQSYLNALETGDPIDLACSSEILWDPDTLARGLATCGGMCAAAQTAMQQRVAGCLASGFHHAKHAQGRGFCTLNGIAVAARLLADRPHRHVLIIDLDAHCGGGTCELIEKNPQLWQIDISTHAFDYYTSTARCVVEVIENPTSYLKRVWRHLKHAEDEWPHFSLCIYNAGMDVHEACQYGGMKGIDELLITLREEMVFQWCSERGIPIAYTMAGGYTGGSMSQRRLVDLHRLTIEAANGIS